MDTRTDLGDNQPERPPETGGTGATRFLGDGSAGPTQIPDRIGKYRIRRLLGRGGMGVVYEGWDESLHRAVAIKLVSPELCKIQDTYERFQREARAAARLNHPNIINVYEFVEDPNQPYLVMEFVEGMDLNTLLKTSGPLKADAALRMIRQAASALKKAAASHLVHRDIKPSNILVTSDGAVKVTDFGLSKLLDSATNLTTSGALMGTPDYMSPEQARGEKLDFRSDMYSLGCTLYALLAGRRPFDSETMAGMIHKHINEALSFPDDWRGKYNGHLVGLITKLTAKKRDDRPASWDEVIATIDAMLEAGTGRIVLPPSITNSATPKRFSVVPLITAGFVVSLIIIAVLISGTNRGRGQGEQPDLVTANEPGAPREQAPPPPGEENAIPLPRPYGEGPAARMAEIGDVRVRVSVQVNDGNFADAREILQQELNSGKPIADATEKLFRSMIEILQSGEMLDRKLREDLRKPNATLSERLYRAREWAERPPAGQTPETAWGIVIYLHLMRQPGAREAAEAFRTAHPGALSQRQQSALMIIGRFFGEGGGPGGGQGGPPPRPPQ